MYKRIFFLVIILVIVFAILLYIKNTMLYHPNPLVVEKYDRFYQKMYQLAESKNHVSNIIIRTSDGFFLDAVHIRNPDSTKCIIFFHGNAGNLSMRFDMIKFLYNYASVIIFDYRSFGKSTGDTASLSAALLQKDAQAVWNHTVQNLHFHPNQISLFGESLGCSIVIELAANLSRNMDSNIYPHSLILIAPFYSLASMVEHLFGKINIGVIGKFLSTLIAHEYQSNEWIKYLNYRTKIIIAHSPRDEVVPYQEGVNLYNSISKKHPYAKFITITGTHNNLGLTDSYIYTLAELFDD